MRLATTIALALCIALPGPIAANASDAVIPIHKHRIHMHQAVQGSSNPGCRLLWRRCIRSSRSLRP